MQESTIWFNKHWNTAEKIDKPLLDQVRPLWQLRKKKRLTKHLLSLLVDYPKSIGRIPVRLIVFEERNKNECIDAWSKVKNEYTDEEIKRNGWSGYNHPFYLDHNARWNIQPGDYFVDYWAKQAVTNSFKKTDGGGAWLFKKVKWIEINGKKTKAILCDRVNEVHRLKITERHWEKLGRKYQNVIYLWM
jgi:hypothetical protein